MNKTTEIAVPTYHHFLVYLTRRFSYRYAISKLWIIYFDTNTQLAFEYFER